MWQEIEGILAEHDNYLTYICRGCMAGPCMALVRDMPDFCPFCSFDEEDHSLWQVMEEEK